MTPTEKKAREIYEKMYNVDDIQGNYPMCKNTAKQCALICVDEIMSIKKLQDIESQDYWQEVKQHIEKL